MQHNARLENTGSRFDSLGLVNRPAVGGAHSSASAQRAQALLATYRLRNSLFGHGRMVDPYWEILLVVFSGASPVDLPQICAELGLPHSAVGRWLRIIERDGLIGPDNGGQRDAGHVAYCMTAKGCSLMEQALP